LACRSMTQDRLGSRCTDLVRPHNLVVTPQVVNRQPLKSVRFFTMWACSYKSL
jgi:hypothetical protein